jgi:hypothetical protein
LQGCAQFEPHAGIQQQAVFALTHLQLAHLSAWVFLRLRCAGQAQAYEGD